MAFPASVPRAPGGLVPLHVRLRDLRNARWTRVQVTEDAVEIAVA
jgi:hypothetical protein